MAPFVCAVPLSGMLRPLVLTDTADSFGSQKRTDPKFRPLALLLLQKYHVIDASVCKLLLVSETEVFGRWFWGEAMWKFVLCVSSAPRPMRLYCQDGPGPGSPG